MSFCPNCCFKVNADSANDDCNGMKHPNPITSDDSANLFNTASSKAKRLFSF